MIPVYFPDKLDGSLGIDCMKFRGKIVLEGKTIAHQVEGELKENTLRDGNIIYRGHFSTMEPVEFTKDDIYRLEVQDGLRTKIKVLALLSDIAGIRVFSCYATHPFH
jgi:hypothetical protein